MENKDIKNSQTQKKIEFSNNFIFGASFFSENVEGQSVDISSTSNWDLAFANNKRKFLGSVGPKGYSGMLENMDEYIDEIINLGIKTVDLSISWSNLFINEKTVNRKILSYYEKLFQKLTDNKIQIVLTFVKFDLPSWFTEKGGFLKKENYEHFEYYVNYVINAFGKYFSISYLFDDPMFIMLKSDLYKKENCGFIARKQEYVDFVLNIAWYTSKILENIKEKQIPIKVGVKHAFIPFCFDGNKNINFNPHSKLYKYNYYINFMLMDYLILGSSEEFDYFSEKFGTTMSLTEEELETVKKYNIDFFGMNYKRICYLTNEKNQNVFELFNEFIYFSKEDEIKDADFNYVRELFQIITLKYKRIPFFFHTNYSYYKDEVDNKNIESKRIEDNYRISFMSNMLCSLNNSMNEFNNVRCLGFIYDNIFDSWSYFNTFNIKDGLIEIDLLKKQKALSKNSAFWYKRLCTNRHFYNFTVKPSFSKEVVLESKTKLIDFF